MRRARHRLRFVTIAFSPAVLVACAGSSHEPVSLNQFAGGVDTSAGAAAPRTVYAPVNPTRPEIETIVIRPMDTRAQAGSPESGEPAEAMLSQPVYDAKIGDINGRPIIASRFLDDLMPRLRAIAAEQADKGRGAWRAEARSVISRKLEGMIRDEVLYREGRARNPELTQQGLLFFVEKVREHVIRQAEGSATLAEERLQEQEGVSLDQFLASIERQRVIKDVLDIVSEDYAPVSWLDIQNEYQRRYDTFNPDPTATFRLISPPNEEAAQKVAERLNNGEAFASIASDPSVNGFAPDRGGKFSEEGTSFKGELADATLISDKPLNEALVALKPGAWAGPVTRSSGRQAFVMLEGVEHKTASLDDTGVQLSIERYLKQVRSEKATGDFIMRLRERANLGPERFEEFVTKIMAVAETRVFELNRQG